MPPGGYINAEKGQLFKVFLIVLKYKVVAYISKHNNKMDCICQVQSNEKYFKTLTNFTFCILSYN